MRWNKVMTGDIANEIGEGIHTSLRKYCESKESGVAWKAISEMPEKEWSYICDIVARETLKRVNEILHREKKAQERRTR